MKRQKRLNKNLAAPSLNQPRLIFEKETAYIHQAPTEVVSVVALYQYTTISCSTLSY